MAKITNNTPSETTATTTTTTAYAALRADWRDIKIELAKVFIPRDVTLEDIGKARSLMAKDLKLNKMSSVPSVRETLKAFLDSNSLDQRLVNFYNNIEGEVSTSELAGLSKNIPIYKDVRNYSFKGTLLTIDEMVRGSSSLGLTLANFLVYTGCGHMFEAERSSVNSATGEVETRTYLHVQFNAKKAEKNDLLFGINSTPGIVNQSFIGTPPGGRPIKVRGAIKDVLADAGSRAINLIDMPDQFWFTLLENSKWHKQSLAKRMEVGASIKARVNSYMNVIHTVGDMDRVYLSMKFDYRYRMYNDMNAFFINPQAKDGKYLWELADAVMLDDVGYKHMVHSAVGLATGKRYSLAKAMQYWNKHEFAVKSALLKFGENKDFDVYMSHLAESIYVRRLLQAINDYRNEVPSKFILLKDFTTGGLIHHSLTFHNEVSAPMCNVSGLATPQNAHDSAAASFGLDGLTREVAKDINMQVLHGASDNSAVGTINDLVGTSLGADQFNTMKINTYGAPIENVLNIVKYGRSMYSKYNPSLLFRTPEGFPTMSVAYVPSDVSNPRMGGTMLEFYMFTPVAQELKQGYRKVHTITSMPLSSDKDGNPIRGSKVSGLYANITHVKDGHTLRIIYQHNAVAISIHDNIGACPNEFDAIEATVVDSFVEDYDARYYERCLNDIHYNAAKDGQPSVQLPVLYYGKLTKSQVKKAKGFLQA